MKCMFLKKCDIYYQKCATAAQRFQLSMTKLGACDEIRWNDGNLYSVSQRGLKDTEGKPLGLLYRARICERLWSPKIDSEESISPAHVAWRAGTTNSVAVPARQAGNRFLGSLKGLQIRAL